MSARAIQLQSSGDVQGAEALYREALALWREEFGDDHVQVGTTLTRLGELLLTKGDDAAAEAALRESIEILGTTEGDARLGLCEPMFALARLLADRGAYAEAEDLLRETLRVRGDASGQKLQIAITVSTLANVVIMSGQEDEGPVVMQQLVDAWRAALPEDSVFLGRILFQVGVFHAQREDDEEAERVLTEAREIFALNPDVAQTQRAQVLMTLASINRRQGKVIDGISIALEGLDLAREIDGGRHVETVVRDLGNLAWAVAAEPERSEADYRAGLTAIELALGEKPETKAYINTLGVLQYRVGEYESALGTLARSDALYSQEYEGGVPADLAFMAMAHHHLGHAEEAAAYMTKLRAAMRNPALSASEDHDRHLAEAEALIVDR